MDSVQLEKKVLLTKLTEIDHAIRANYEKEQLVGVLAGTSGASLFQFYYSKYLDIDENSTFAADLLNLGIARISEGFNHLSYCSGLSGMGWTLDHLAMEGFLDEDMDSFLTQIDLPIFNEMISTLKQGNYDFLHGAIGHAYYFLNRYRSTGSKTLKSNYKKKLSRFLVEFERISEKDGTNMIKWPVRSGDLNDSKNYDLGLSHGMASIISFLTRLYQIDDFKRKTAYLLNGAVEYILQCKNEDSGLVSLFPTSVSAKNNSSRESRLAWCYGDLGIGFALYSASKILERNMLKENSLEILRHCVGRVGSHNSGVRDASICHGSFGISQIFNRLFKDTGEVTFKNAARYWINDGLLKGIDKMGYAGYRQWNHQNQDWYPTISLLEGISGIGLTLIDYLADFDTTWDECLMIS
ncbi:lanthionine synthetase C family protein [Maribacter sp. 2-571]|uniref:lanthionine synthetase C family protein n=1 Tax=Maribacter sp. 2-571 TaxID=3417569 RepID=UPI003D331E2B